MNRLIQKSIVIFLAAMLFASNGLCVELLVPNNPPIETDSAYVYEFRFKGNINLDEGMDINGSRFIGESGMSYGPYLDLLPDTYHVLMTGTNMEQASLSIVSSYHQYSHEIDNLNVTPSEITFDFVLSEPAYLLELLCANQGTEMLILSSVVITAENDKQPVENDPEIRVRIVMDNNLNMHSGEDINGMRYLYQGGLSYGPYITLLPGMYEVVITGSNLTAARVDFAAEHGQIIHPLYNALSSSRQIRYIAYLAEEAVNIETRIFNDSEETITIDSILIRNIAEL